MSFDEEAADAVGQIAITLPQLQRIYRLERREIVGQLEPAAASFAEADEAVQNTFAVAARRRFSFRNERELVAWIRSHAHEQLSMLTQRPQSAGLGRSGWEDVLERAAIRVQPPPSQF